MATTLVRMGVIDRLLGESFWPRLAESADTQPAPPRGIYRELAKVAQAEVTEPRLSRWVRGELAEVKALDDTHPTLTQRLEALGQAERIEELTAAAGQPLGESAAARLLGPAVGRYRELLDARFAKLAGESWKTRHQKAKEGRADYDQLRRAAAERTLTTEEQDRLLGRIAQFEGHAKACEYGLALIRERPDAVDLLFTVGARLLEHRDQRGLELLERAMARDLQLVPEACGRVERYWHEEGRPSLAEPYAVCRQDAEALLRRASEASEAPLRPNETFLPHGQAAADVALAVADLRRIPLLAGAWLVRREQAVLPEVAWLVLLLEFGKGQLSPEQAAVFPELLASAIARFDSRAWCRFLVMNEQPAAVRRKLEAVRGGRIL